MKRLALGLALSVLTSLPALAGGLSFDLPRLDFPTGGTEVSQACNPLTQVSCGG